MAEILKNPLIDSERIVLIRNVLPTQPGSTAPIDPAPEISQALDEKTQDQHYQSGYEQGRCDTLHHLNAQTETLKALLTSLPKAIEKNRESLASEVADIVLIIIQQLFIHQQHDPKVIEHQINTIITQLNAQQRIDLYLHPDDLERLKRGDLNMDTRDYRHLRLMANDDLTLGGCIVKCEHGLFDASIERKIDQLKQVLLQIQSQKTSARKTEN